MEERYFTIGNTLALAFILFTLCAITIWNFPREGPEAQARLDPFRSYMRYTGLWQHWNMFSPEVVSQSNHARIIGSTKNGDIVYEPEYGYGAMRHIKFLENILGNPEYVDAYLRRVCANMGATNVTLYVKRQPIMRFEETTVEEAPYVQNATVSC